MIRPAVIDTNVLVSGLITFEPDAPTARVWVASSEDVPGLITEAPTMEALITKLQAMIPELLELNGVSARRGLGFELVARTAVPLTPAGA